MGWPCNYDGNETATTERKLKIIIQTNADFTPAGKRNARIVTTSRGGKQIRWYVSGRLYRYLAPNAENIALTHEWMGA